MSHSLSHQTSTNDPPDFGPATWKTSEWLGLGIYVLIFGVIVFLIAKLAAPRVESEVDAKESEAPPGNS